MRRHLRNTLWVMALLAGCGGDGGGNVTAMLQPPAPGDGFQFAITPFEVPAGEEVQACYFFAVPGKPGEEVWVNHYEIAQSVGSHHSNVFRVKTVVQLGGQPGDVIVSKNGKGPCFDSANWADWPLVANSQDASSVDWKLPDGVGAKFMAGELLMLQTHWVNATTQKTPKEAAISINFYTMKQPAANELGTFFATNQNIRICPGDVGRSFTKTCHFGGTQPLTVIAANGHFHSRGKEFDMYTTDADGNIQQQFYQSLSWDDPPMSRDFQMQVPQGGGVEWKCTYDFPEGGCGGEIDATTGQPTCCFKFGGVVETAEHCNAFVYYYPKTEDINCF